MAENEKPCGAQPQGFTKDHTPAKMKGHQMQDQHIRASAVHCNSCANPGHELDKLPFERILEIPDTAEIETWRDYLHDLYGECSDIRLSQTLNRLDNELILRRLLVLRMELATLTGEVRDLRELLVQSRGDGR